MSPSTFATKQPRTIPFTGKVVRFEADGFGIIEFDRPIGPSSNSFGVVTTSTTFSVSPLTALRPGLEVKGMAEADERNVASIKTFEIFDITSLTSKSA
jgi:hypothetical protein